MSASAGTPGVVSIHAPVEGAPVLFGVVLDFVVVSIHAPVEGATPARQAR